jgi:VanZ family protein
LAVLWGVLLFTLTSWPRPPSVPILSAIPNFDKLVHFGLYSVEAFFLYQAVRWAGRNGFSFARVLAITGLMLLWGTMDEVHQYWIPGRSTEVADAAADTTGGFVGALAASLLAAKSRPGRADSSLRSG